MSQEQNEAWIAIQDGKAAAKRAKRISSCVKACICSPDGFVLIDLGSLPHGWTVQLDIQRDSRGVTLFGPFDDMYEIDTGNGIEADIQSALKFAIFRTAESEKAVNGAWARFQAEMKK